MSEAKTPKELDAFVDKVLAYKPKPTTDAGKARKRKANKALDGKVNQPSLAPPE